MSEPPTNSPVVSPRDQRPASPADRLSNGQLVRWMARFLRPVKGLAMLACLFLTTQIAAEVLAVRQVAEAVNAIKQVHLDARDVYESPWQWLRSDAPQTAELRTILVSLVAFIGAMVVARYLRETTSTRMSMTMVFHLREAVYDKLQHVGIGFHDANTSGQLINRALSDLQNIRMFLQTAVLVTLEMVLIVGGYMLLIATRNLWLAALALAPLPFWLFYVRRFGRNVRPIAKQVMEAQDTNVSMITEAIAGVHVIKAFATEKFEIDRYNRNCDAFFDRVLSRVRKFANFMPVIRLIAMASHLSLFFVAGVLSLYGRLGIGDLLILGSAMGAILGRLQQVNLINEQYQNALVSGRRLYEVLTAEPTVAAEPHARPLPPGRGAIAFENVTFGYAPGKPVLHDVSFDVPAGSTVALVGPTGAGKTTIVNLIARFYDPQQGRVLIDGADVRDVSLADLRSQVAYVFQETYLFSDTVEANVAYGRPTSRDDRGLIEAAARVAQAHEFIETMPRGYGTVLAERGASLSGGQRQRLAIARAVVHDPRILVLDDATAAVDPETEYHIGRGMKLVMSHSTVVLVAHRISTIKHADLILVVEDGRITQQGTHAELIEQPGYYRDITQVQTFGEDGDDYASHMDRMYRQFAERRAARRPLEHAAVETDGNGEVA